jgi:hypothetical protein
MSEGTLRVSEDTVRLARSFQSGANWFYWITGLSIINSIAILSGAQWAFVVGLGITQIIDAIGMAIAEQAGNAAKFGVFALDVVAAGTFALFGFFAGKGHAWAFITGMVLYGIDGLLFLIVQDWLSIGFHIFVLFAIFSGFKACAQLKALAAAAPAAAAAPPALPQGPA